MEITMRIEHPIVVKTFNNLSVEQIGRIVKRFLGDESCKLLTQEEVDVFKEIMLRNNERKLDYKERVRKAWETKRKRKLEIEQKLKQLDKVQNTQTSNTRWNNWNNGKKDYSTSPVPKGLEDTFV